MDYDVIVAGGGISGLTAGMVSARLGRSSLIVIGDVLGGHLLSIEKVEGYPGFSDGIAGYELCPMTQGQAAEAGAEFSMSELQSFSLDGDVWRVMTGEGEHTARAVVLATGTTLRELGVPGEDRLRGKGVSHCASCDAPMLRDQPVVVVGGGDSALQEALTLAETVGQVTILHRGDGFSAQATYGERVSDHPKIKIKFGDEVEEILGDDVVTGVKLGGDSSEVLDAAAVFIYVGLEPVTGFAEGQITLDAGGRIVIDTSMRTVQPGLLAAGTVRSGAAGRAAAAASDGTTAAIAADRYLNDGGWATIN